MKVQPPLLLPILRSRTQAALLTRLLLNPEDEVSLSQLAQSVDASLPTTLREVERAESTGVVKTRNDGNKRLVSVDESSPLYRPLRDLLLTAFGPMTVIAQEFAEVADVQAVAIFGSWAARYQNAPGKDPKDIDVLVVGKPDRDQVFAAAERSQRRLGRPVHTTIRSKQKWHSHNDPFVQTVRSRPYLIVLGSEE